MCASLVQRENISEIPSSKCQHCHSNASCRWNMRLVYVIIWCIFLIMDLQVTNVDIPSDIPEHTKIEQSQTSLQGKETVSHVQETETLTSSSSLATSLPVDQSKTSSITEGSFSSTQVEPSFTDIQGTSQTEQYLTETVTQSASVVQSEVPLHNANAEVETGTENGKSTDEPVPVKDDVEKSENFRADVIDNVKDSVKVLDTEVKDAENVKDTDSVKVTEDSEKDTEASQNITTVKENVDQSEESGTTLQKEPSSQTSGGEPVGGQKVDGEPAEIQTEDKHEGEGLTFSEWRLKVLAEAETGKLEGKEDGQNLQVLTGKQRKKKNYASQECGAKILASNPEASSPKSVLNSNRDEYMNNPCKAKRWFVIELCEPIQAHSVDLASLELFSSQPKKFKIYLGDRYPTKDWKAVGEFTLKEERSIQNFTLKEAEDYFTKFVRVELTEHYGNEHFCPLTIFRVLGIAVGEYEDDSHNADDDDDDDSDNEDTNEREVEAGSKNLFTSAKDTVINIVKKVLNVDSEEEQMVQNGTQLNVTSGVDNATMNGTMTTDQQSTLPCVPDVTSDGSKEKPCKEDMKEEDQQKYTLPVAPEPGKTDSKIVVKLEDDEQVETTPDTTPGKSLDSHIKDCFLALPSLAISEKKYSVTQAKLCEFVYMLKKQSPVRQLSRGRSKKRGDDTREAEKDQNNVVTSDQNDKRKNQAINSTIPVQVTHIEPDEVVVTVSDSASESSANSGSSTVQSSKVSESKNEQESSVDKSKSELPKTATLSTSSLEIQQSTTAEDIVATGTKIFSSTKTVDHASVKQTGSVTSSTVEQNEQTESGKIEPSPTVVETLGEVTPDTSREATPVLPESWKPDTKDLLQQKTMTENQKTQDGTITQTDIKDKPEPSSITAQSKESIASSLVNGESIQLTETVDTSVNANGVEEMGEDMETLVEETQEQKPNTTVIDDKVVVSNGGQQKRDDLNLVKLPAIPSGKRESAIMRLSNRIKVLEQNVSLSSRFLEELSRRYKKQSEDMMKMLNKTMAAMHNMSVEADVKNKLHVDEMSAMERRLENLTEIVHQLTNSFDKLNKQVTDRQMIWTTIEIAIIIFMLLFLHFRRKKVDLPPESRSLIETMPSKPSSSHPQRRNSLSGPATPSKERNFGNLHTGGGLQRFNSETALDSADTCSAVKNAADFPFKPGSDGVKKKKKKKHKNLENRLSSSGSTSSVLPSISSTHQSSHDSTNNEFQSTETSLQPSNISNQSKKEFSQLFAKSNQSKEIGAQASCNMSQTQSSCFGSLLSGWSNSSTAKQRSSSLGTEVNEAKELKVVGETLVKGAQKDGFGAKLGTKGLTKKPPVSGSSKISPKLNLKVSKFTVNGSMNGNMDQNVFRLDDKKIVKGHRRQKSLPKQHYSSVETVGSLSNESASNGLQGLSQRFEIVPLSSKGNRKGEMKKSSSLPVSPDSNFEKPPVHSKSFANGYYENVKAVNDTWPTGNGFPFAKSKSDHSCSDTYGKNTYNSELLSNGASCSKGTVYNENACSGINQINGLRGNHDDTEHDRGRSGPFDVDNTSSVQNGKNGVWKNVFGYFR